MRFLECMRTYIYLCKVLPIQIRYCSLKLTLYTLGQYSRVYDSSQKVYPSGASVRSTQSVCIFLSTASRSEEGGAIEFATVCSSIRLSVHPVPCPRCCCLYEKHHYTIKEGDTRATCTLVYHKGLSAHRLWVN